jgi:ATP-binding cassette subfamily B protein
LSCGSDHRAWIALFPPELRWLSKQIRPLLHWHIASFSCITVTSVLTLLPPLILKWMIDVIIPQRRMVLLLGAVLLMFLAHEGRTFLNSCGNYLMLSAAQKTGLSMRLGMFRHLNRLSADYYENTPPGAAMYPLKEPIEEIAYFASDLLPAMLRIFLTTGFTLSTMSALDPLLTLIVLPLIPIFLMTRQHYRKRLAANADVMQLDRQAWSNFLHEHVSAAIPIQLLGQEQRQERMAFRLLARAVRSYQRLNRTGVRFTVCSSLAVVTAMCAVVGYGGAAVVRGAMSTGSLVAFYGFIAQLFDPLSSAAELYARTQRTFASIRQAQSTFDLRPSVINPPVPLCMEKAHALQIEFQNVTFGYARQKDMLQIPSLRIAPGENVAIVGENGAGKSTLAKLIARIYDPQFGSIRIGGLNIRDIDLKILRDYVCYLPREPVLFDGTVLSNVRLIRPSASQYEVHEAIRDAGLSNLIANLPQGIHHRIGPGGCQLSGGERQRLAIARALLQDPRILIIDEATSCLDSSAETTILQNLGSKLRMATVIFISHRSSTVSMFPRTLVLSEGRIVEDSIQGFNAVNRTKPSPANIQSASEPLS